MTKFERSFFDAALAGNALQVSAALERGFDINLRDSRGIPKMRTALMHAADKGHLEVCRILLSRGAKTEVKDKGLGMDFPGGNTALLLSLKSRYLEVAELLLNFGANPEVKGGGTTILCAAV